MNLIKYCLLLTVILNILLPEMVRAQKGLFEEEVFDTRKGLLIGFTGSLDFPAGDLAKRYGTSYRAGASLGIKSKTNFIYGIKFEFSNGTSIKEDSFMANIKNDNNTIYSIDGQALAVNTYRRGYLTGVELGKIFSTSKVHKDNGILAMIGVGFWQHKITIQDKSESIVSLRGDYRKGYDRLANGVYTDMFLGYIHFSRNSLVNFSIGLQATLGFIEGRREWLFDVNRPGTDQRTDIMYGIKGSWYIPAFKRKSEEFYFE